ncbi:hypothetical protein KY359_03270 [Candidatus Woesearchaeota archaeon]|nr:hypothetical protein [Candidatus Woesearchaeota archaeon]
MRRKDPKMHVCTGFFGDKDTILTQETADRDRPPLLVELFGRQLCGRVEKVFSALIEGNPASVYLVRSDEVIDAGRSYLDPLNRRAYHIAGEAGLQAGDRLHAYVTRRRRSVRFLHPRPSDGPRVDAHLIRWYSNLTERMYGSREPAAKCVLKPVDEPKQEVA